MKPTCISLDLDNTISYFKRRGSVILDAAVKLGIPRNTVTTTYQSVREIQGFSPKNFRSALERLGPPFDGRLFEKQITEFLESSLALYADSRTLRRTNATRSNIPIVIVTAGDTQFQKRKKELLELRVPCFVVQPHEGKIAPLQKLLARYGAPIWHVDDRVEELDKIYTSGLVPKKIETIQIVRGMMPRVSKNSPHRRIRTLASLFHE